jgi:hypothetical protein
MEANNVGYINMLVAMGGLAHSSIVHIHPLIKELHDTIIPPLAHSTWKHYTKYDI